MPVSLAERVELQCPHCGQRYWYGLHEYHNYMIRDIKDNSIGFKYVVCKCRKKVMIEKVYET